MVMACYYGGEIGALCGGAPDISYDNPDEIVKHISAVGVNAVLGVFSIGESRKFEAPQYEEFRELARALHADGRKIIAYTKGYTTTYSYLDEEPDAMDWLFVKENGDIRHCFREDLQRYYVCPTSPWFERYFARVIPDAAECGADGIFLDNTAVGELCWCSRCREAFAQFTKDWPGAPFTYGEHPAGTPTAAAVSQFKKHLCTQIYRKADDVRRKLGLREFPIVTSPGYPLIGSFEMEKFKDIVQLYEGLPDRNTRIFLTNSSYYQSRGIPSCSILLSFMEDMSTLDSLDFTFAQGLFHNERIIVPYAFWMDMEKEPGHLESAGRWNSFMTRHMDTFKNLDVDADAALYFSHKTFDLKDYPGSISAYRGWENWLTDNGITYRLVFDDDEQINDTRLLILPDVLLMDEKELQMVEEFVSKGGRVILTGRTGTLDGYGMPHKFSLAERLGLAPAGDEESIFAERSVRIRKPADRDYFNFMNVNLERYSTSEEFNDYQIKHRSSLVLKKSLQHLDSFSSRVSVSNNWLKTRFYACNGEPVVQFMNYGWPEWNGTAEVNLSGGLPPGMKVHMPEGTPSEHTVEYRDGAYSIKFLQAPLYALFCRESGRGG